MAKTFTFVIPAVFLFLFGICEALECYHCYSNGKFDDRDGNFVPCNDANLAASNTWFCPYQNDRCVYRVIDVQSTKSRQIWRTCSNGVPNPCDPSNLAPGMTQVKCTLCSTDKCNLYEGVVENQNKTFTFNINANVNLFIRQ